MNVLGAIRTWNRVRNTRNQLSGLSNQLLDDLGVTREEILAVAKRSRRK